ncbi:hypothetical protein [Streptomyces sp. Ag109_G2-15]|uniref:hypothetical protein n=1 Tax=Streptomyces sp. Ag109_G2-15 TaxID=1938850 RepID=UPI000BD17BE3|nr:hypothetical protein [Streptomyces sp. Ag109_G2-15]SOD84234.1 hypothetical protein SAMN06272765_1611 [Streptomyces sp. Ag109_G2-15]
MSEDLPLLFGHVFQVWSYSKSHRKLVLRGRPGQEYDEFVDVVFNDVLGMKIASSYPQLSVAIAADVSEMDEFLDMPERYDRGFVNLEVSDGTRRGFVVCKSVVVHRGTGWYGQENSSGDPCS